MGLFVGKSTHSLAQAREAKESILVGEKDSVEIVLAGSGSSLFKSSMKTTLEKTVGYHLSHPDWAKTPPKTKTTA